MSSERPVASLPAEAPADREVSPDRGRTAMFMRMWAVAHMIHLVAANHSRLDTPWNVAAFIMALALLLRPLDGRLLAGLALAQLADMVVEMPISPDHWMLISFVNLTLLVAMLVKRSFKAEAISSAFPAARVVVLVAYAAAALSKYNHNFVTAASSCATAIAEQASYGLSQLVPVAGVFFLGSIIIESSIPLLLLWGPTRPYAVRLGLAFHFLLSVSPAFAVVDFTATLYALFLLFLPPSESRRVRQRIGDLAHRLDLVRRASAHRVAAACAALLVFGLLGYASVRVSSALVFVASQAYLLCILVATVTTRPEPVERQPIGRVRVMFVPVIALAVLWAANPYIGLRTAGVFTMFSGLRTEGQAPNHLFMPVVHLTSWQDDFVVIESSNDPTMAAAQGGRAGVPLLALRREAQAKPDLVVVGTVNGQRQVFGPGPGQQQFAPLGFFEDKFAMLRPVAVSSQRYCNNT